jgi:cell division protein FtsB
MEEFPIIAMIVILIVSTITYLINQNDWLVDEDQVDETMLEQLRQENKRLKKEIEQLKNESTD